MELLHQIKKKLQESTFKIEVWLYGSFARGQQKKESDIDLLVLGDTELLLPQDKRRIACDLYELEFATGYIISPLIMTKKNWSERPKTPFYENVSREAIQL